MIPLEQALATPAPAQGDGPALRPCLRCRTPFASHGFGERICRRCKGKSAWTSAIPSGGGSRPSR
jgi:hypothetical protein